jgi:hypothetical protein
MPHRTPPAAPTLGAPTLSRREAGAALVEALDVLSAALPRAVQMARTEERAAERAAVVAWLRDVACGIEREEHDHNPRLCALCNLRRVYAGCIERGEHRREETK